jgi:viroplasmin and RNaseH domain-containing protein
VVTHGRVKGIFDRWCDAFASVAGFSGAKVKGFTSLADAKKAWGHAGEAEASNAHPKR